VVLVERRVADAGVRVYPLWRHNFYNQRLCMDLASALRTFIRVVERGSMTAAASDLGISQPAVSKLLRNLELHTGARLLERSSRAMRPTPHGLVLYEASGGALSAIDAAIEAVRSDVGAINGNLRLHGPTCVGEHHLHRIVMNFQDKYPAVTVDLILENRSVDLIHENVDLSIRMGRATDQNVIARRIGFSKRLLVASPEYLARRGPVRDRRDISKHDLIVTNASLARGGILKLCKRGTTTEIAVRPKLTTNNAQVLVDALKAGRGIGTAQVLLVADELKLGRLIRVLPEYELTPTELFLTYPSSKFMRLAVRSFIDFAVPALLKIEGIVQGHE
jgi:DNA-binding transcriptional LysR family regulator